MEQSIRDDQVDSYPLKYKPWLDLLLIAASRETTQKREEIITIIRRFLSCCCSLIEQGLVRYMIAKGIMPYLLELDERLAVAEADIAVGHLFARMAEETRKVNEITKEYNIPFVLEIKTSNDLLNIAFGVMQELVPLSSQEALTISSKSQVH